MPRRDLLIPNQAGEPRTVEFVKPFVFFIRYTTTGALLFAGKISDL